MKKVLIVVDPQIDFIYGTMKVEKAGIKMMALSRYLKGYPKDKDKNYEHVIISQDWHPEDHCSFIPFGPWPKHCVQFTTGALIYPELMDSLYYYNDTNMIFAPKGIYSHVDHYSIEGSPKWSEIVNLIQNVDQIDICGIAGDYCVHDTIQSLINHGFTEKICVLTDFVASIDDGEKLYNLIVKHNLKYV